MPDQTRTDTRTSTVVQPDQPQLSLSSEVRDDAAADTPGEVVFAVKDVTIAYDGIPAVRDVSLDIHRNQITALIGPSGCGKSTLLRAFNRTNDLIPSASISGTIDYMGRDLYAKDVDPVEVRRVIGMVFQKPNPFPKSIYDNIAFGPRVLKMKVDMDEVVEEALRGAALWEEVKDKLGQSAYSLSGGQQQRLCIARAIAVKPDVILMDEPCSALDPIATARIEDLMSELKSTYTIVIVTHNMQQAARACDRTAFFTTEVTPDPKGLDRRSGRLVEYAPTAHIFTNPSDPRTQDYVSGRFG